MEMGEYWAKVMHLTAVQVFDVNTLEQVKGSLDKYEKGDGL